MRIRIEKSDWRSVECDALLVPIFKDDDLTVGFAAELNECLGGLLQEITETGEWQGKLEEFSVIHRPSGLKIRRLVLLGAGERNGYDNSHVIRTVTMKALYRLKASGMRTIAVYRRSTLDPRRAIQAAVEGVLLGLYQPDEYKTSDRSTARVEEMVFITSDDEVQPEAVEEAIRRGEILGKATNLARRLVNEPANSIGPVKLAEKAQEIAEKVGLAIEVLDEQDMERLGMNAVLAVARGSDEGARFIILRHQGAADPDEAPAVLIGKGVTFDSGGLSLKPAQSMEEMKADKAGACAVLAAMKAIAELQLPTNVVGLMPAVENMPSGRAQRPGDVVRSMSGKTIEVLNTDAEGRLILADALHYAQRFKPRFMVDVATLTGACVVALGRLRAGLFSNDDRLCAEIIEASDRAGERLWRFPLDSEYRKDLESDIADIKNIGERWGGAITAAKFLEEFVNGVPWGHLDIAGVDMYTDQDVMSGPTGFAVRTLAELVS